MATKNSPETLRIRRLLRGLDRVFPDPKCELDYESTFQLLIAVILSAQCTDKRVNIVTPDLFRAYPTPEAMAGASQEAMEKLIHSTGFFRNKAKNIIACSRRIVERHNGQVPSSMEELVALAGVARKTANVVLGECFGIAEGVVVDTHVARQSNLLGLTKQKDPKRIEKDLMALIPKKKWIKFSHQMVLHGRRTCIARRPQCDECTLAKDCPSRMKKN